MAKNKRRKIPPPKPGLQKILKKGLVDQHIQQMDTKINQMIELINQISQQSEITRLGVVTINKLHFEGQSFSLENKMRQVLFGILSVLESRYPTILAEIHDALNKKEFAHIEDVLGKFESHVGYTLNEFERLFQEHIPKHMPPPSSSPPIPSDQKPLDIDEEGSDDEAALEFEKLIGSSDPDQHFVPVTKVMEDTSMPVYDMTAELGENEDPKIQE